MKASLFVLSTVFLASFAFADSPQGVWHTKIGNVEFYCIQDASSEANSSVLLTDDKDALARLAPTGKTPSGCTVFVVKKGTDTVLIDTGIGRQSLERLQTIGIKPEDVKHILLTHSHGDHVGGLVKDGRRVFPNAAVWLDERELAFWKSARNKDFCEQVLKLYGEPKFLTPDEKTSVIFPECVTVDLAGHTPGHVGFLISGGGRKLFVVGDMLHNGAVQFARPDISIQYDSDPKEAADVRHRALKRAAEEKLLLAATHLAFPPVGEVTIDRAGFRFIPLETPAHAR